MPRRGAVESAQMCALRFLNTRERFAVEIAGHLRQKGFPEDEIASTLDELQKEGWQSDCRAAREEVEQLLHKGFAHDRIRKDLMARGAQTDVIEDILAVAPTDEELARDLLAQKRPKSPAAAARLLLNRGYSEESVGDVVRGIWGGDE